MKDRQTGDNFAIEHLVKTITGNLVVKGLQEKRKKIEERIEDALLKHAEMLFKKKINHTRIKEELQMLANVIIERYNLTDEFFKYKITVSTDKPNPHHAPDNNKKTVEDHLSILDTLFKV